MYLHFFMRLSTLMILIFTLTACTVTSADDDGEILSFMNSQQEISAAEDFFNRLPETLCQWYVSCGQFTSDDLNDCIEEIRPEIMSDIYKGEEICGDVVTFYIDHRSALDDCIQNPTTACDSDDLDAFCPAFESIDPNNFCTDESESSSQSSAGAEGGSVMNNSGDFTPDFKTLIVGAWAGNWMCTDVENPASGMMYWTLCPNGNLRGITKLESSTLSVENLASGSYSINESTNEVSIRLVETVVNPSIIRGDQSSTDLLGLYSSTDDAVQMRNYCGFWMVRLEGGGYDEINNSDCESSVTTVGGGDDACGTDCDCGRCWYCESGTCRYGGEGPYGCYRGCN